MSTILEQILEQYKSGAGRQERAEKEGSEKLTEIKRAIGKELKATTGALETTVKMAETVKDMRRDLEDIGGTVLELNRSINDMHSSSREELARLIQRTSMSPPKPMHVAKRWQRLGRKGAGRLHGAN